MASLVVIALAESLVDLGVKGLYGCKSPPPSVSKTLCQMKMFRAYQVS